MRKFGLLPLMLMAATLWALQGSQPAKNAQLGAVQNENRTATEPQIGYAAQNQTENTMIGCVGGSPSDPLLVQQREHRTYRLEGNTGDIKFDLGKTVKVTGRLMPGTGPSVRGANELAPVFQVKAVQMIAESCHYQGPPGQAPVAVTGKTGGEGEAMNASSTASQGQVTPGFETTAGRSQAPGPHTGLATGGVRQPQNRTATQGAPPNWEQSGQNSADAEAMAQVAHRAELDNSRRQLGVNAQPNYAQNNSAAAAQNTARNRDEHQAAGARTDATYAGGMSEKQPGRSRVLAHGTEFEKRVPAGRVSGEPKESR